MSGWRSPRGATWSPTRFARRSALGYRRGQTLALVAVSALITACTAFAPVYDRAMQQALVDTQLARASVAERTVTVWSEALVQPVGATEARDPREVAAMVPARVAARLEPPVLARTASANASLGDVPPTGPLLWREGACEHLRLLSGSCPNSAGEILVSEADAGNYGLAIGATTTVDAAVDGPGVELAVVGTYEPRDPAWWQGQTLLGISGVSQGPDPTAAHDAWLTTEETFAGAPILPGERSQVGALLHAETIGVEELLALDRDLGELARALAPRGPDLHVRSQLRAFTDDLRAQTRQAHRTVPMLMAPMAVLTLFVLWLVLGAATEQRRGEVAVARLRGRGPAGAAGLLLLELLPVLLVGVVPGAAAALLGGALARALLPGAAPFEWGPGFAAAVGLAVGAVVLTTVAAAVRVAAEPLDGLVRRGPVRPARWSLGAVDAFLLAAVGTGVLVFATGNLSGPFALAGPALLALFAGLLLAHVAAPAATALGRRLLHRGRLVAGVTLIETGRGRVTRTAIVVITVASALAVFALDALDVGARNRANASQHEAGAPAALLVEGRDLDGVRTALDAVDGPATPVMVADGTLAVDPDEFRRIALFPRGAPTAEQWRAIAPPENAPVVLTGTRVSLTVRAGAELTVKDALGTDSEVDLGLVVTTGTGARHTIPLGTVPPAGEQSTLVGDGAACASGCRLAAVELTAPPGVEADGGVDLLDLRVDGRLVVWGTTAEDWNTTQDTYSAIRPSRTASGDGVRLLLSLGGIYPVHLTPAWVPATVPALLTHGRRDPLGPVVTGLDGDERLARDVGRVPLVPAMPRRAALVDLDGLSRGERFTHDSRLEVWLADDPGLVAAVRAALADRGIAVTGERRLATVRRSYDDTVAGWSLVLGAVVGAAAILVGLLVLLVLAVTGWRERSRDLAALRLNGASRRTTRRIASLAQVPAVVLAVGAGVVSGLVGGALAMPDVPFFTTPPEVPVVDLDTSWRAVLGAAVACLVALPTAAVLAGRVVARRAHLERVKETV